MRIAVWDEPALDFFARAAQELAHHHNLTILRLPRRQIRDMLVSGQVDVGLLPTLSVFRDYELFDVLPAVAISSWEFPFLKLYLKKGLSEPAGELLIDPSLAQEAIIAKVVLKEHYDLSPVFKPFEGNLAVLEDSPGLGGAFVPADFMVKDPEVGAVIDLGRDWFELTHYPMAWGLFVMRHGEAEGKAVNILRDIAGYTELKKEQWLDDSGFNESLHHFFSEGLRYRLDDLVTASITSFQDYLYYNDAVDEIVPLPFFEVPEGEADVEDGPLL